MTEREFQTIIDKLDNLERKVSKVDRDNQLLAEKLELYAKVSEAQINSIRADYLDLLCLLLAPSYRVYQ